MNYRVHTFNLNTTRLLNRSKIEAATRDSICLLNPKQPQ